MVNIINAVLIGLGNAALWLGGVILDFFALLGQSLYWLLNPVLSPVLAFLNPICTVVGDGVYAVLDLTPPWLSLTILSTIIGVLLLIAFRYTSNQKAIGRARDDITANLLVLKLFKDDLWVGFRAQGRLLGALGRLQWHMLRPVLIMLFPLVLIVAQMGLRHQWRPLEPGEQSLLRLTLSPDHADVEDAAITSNPGLVIEAGPVPGYGELVWRVRGGELGRHTIEITIAGQTLTKEVVVGRAFERVSAIRAGHVWTTQILHPAEPRLPADAPAAAIEILYYEYKSYFHGASWWILWFFIISMAAALIFKPVFKVRF